MAESTLLAASLGAAVMICSGCGGDVAVTEAPECRVTRVAFSVGAVEAPGHVFGDVVDVALVPDFRVAVVDRQARAVPIFGPGGELERVLGREGDGPGEFLDPIAIATRGDWVHVWDWRQRRITAFELSSDSVETFAVPSQLNPTHHFGLLGDGRYVVGANTGQLIDETAGSEFWVRDLGVVIVDVQASTVDTVAHVPDQLVGWVDQEQRRTGSPFFAPRAHFSAAGRVVYWTRGDLPEVVLFEPGGLDTITWDQSVDAVTEGHVQAYREAWLRDRPESMHPAINRLFEVMPASETFPALQAVLPDSSGGFWAKGYSAPTDSSYAMVRLEDRQVYCRMELPHSFEPMRGERSWLLGVAADELGVPRVERWEIELVGPDL